MHEEIVKFGPNDSLVGVLNVAQKGPRQTSSTPLAILLNAGIVHRVGPYRLHVDIARQLAMAGFSSCRVDLSGLGDSPIRTDIADPAQRAIQDGRELLDALYKSTGFNRFVLMGLCSGSFHAHQLSLADSRVVGGIFMDGFTYRTSQHRWRMLRKKLSYRFLRNAIKRRLLKLKPTEQEFGSDSQPAEFGFFDQHQDATAVASEIGQLLERDMQLMYLFTGGNPDFSAVDQFAEMFGIPTTTPGISVHYLPKSEHTFPLVQSRIEVVDLIVQWYRHNFSPPQSDLDLIVSNGEDRFSPLSPFNDHQALTWTSPWALPPSPLAMPQSVL